MKSLFKITLVVIAMIAIVSCKKDTRPNYQFMPNMQAPVGYETYGEYDIFPGEQSAMLPVEGTIARGYSLFDYGSSNEEYLRAKAELMSPLDSAQVDLARGKELYDIYCGICHGNKGDGQGNKLSVAVVLDGLVYSAPTVQTEIAGGQTEITGRFSQQEAAIVQ